MAWANTSGIEGLTECKASTSNLKLVQVKDIVKKVKDHLKTYSSAGMDISWVSRKSEYCHLLLSLEPQRIPSRYQLISIPADESLMTNPFLPSTPGEGTSLSPDCSRVSSFPSIDFSDSLSRLLRSANLSSLKPRHDFLLSSCPSGMTKRLETLIILVEFCSLEYERRPGWRGSRSRNVSDLVLPLFRAKLMDDVVLTSKVLVMELMMLELRASAS
ncbi:hypothetical protein Tco_0799506 [Tanacetum coccineum]|uniref:Uncharacterized protein n=1 Tax=Tanacetum coccineum TaxID=301880 RepID=A0ABQ4ZUL8_9ASTR